MSNEQNTPEVVQFQPYGSEPVAEKPGKAELAWFTDEETGYHAEIELNGQKFQVREVSDDAIKEFGGKEREVAKELQVLAREQKAFEDSGEEMSPEKVDEFSKRSTDLLEQQFAHSTELLQKTLVGWSLPRELNPDNIAKLSKSARRKLAELVSQRSTLGADEQSFLGKRSRK